METASKATYKLLKRAKDDKFEVDRLHLYCITIQIGIKDLQILVVDTETSSCVLIENFALNNVTTISERLQLLADLFESHSLLKAGFWKVVKISLKTHKFSLIPSALFEEESMGAYLRLNCQVNDKIEGEYYYQHKGSNVVNAYAFDGRLVKWVKGIYPNKKVVVFHQGSALIEGVLRYASKISGKAVFGIQDRGVLHVFVAESGKLLYYNQFAIKTAQEFVKYTLMVFKEFGLNPKSQLVVLWGTLTNQSEQYINLKKYIANVQFGDRPSYLRLSYHFDDIPDHQYFDLFSTYLCD